ncbi:MAG: alanine--tRNA ligase [Holosporaceae bacterium]|jgi:alanyl-tRNA synthetase|nr:alanine--tRNA ligase [Holosporaceae bacterium]
MLASSIRNCFLKFFENNGHKIIESSSVVPSNDPTLLFTNSGMVQFKNVFVGLEARLHNCAATAQKCIRAGGKHNDLDQVGFTARHHTFFEMLGNFSFGDYFKEDAINFAWTFLTKELEIPKSKLLVTVFHTDEEAKAIWRKFAGDILIIPISTNDKLWSRGEVGPCGPCTEIFYDHGGEIPGGMPGTTGADGDRYMEIWNIVFMQFDQKENGEKIPLQKQSIDTGIGLERLTSLMQGFNDNYQIDLFRNIIGEIKSISKTNHEDTYPSYKVIADHIRSISFLIADGVTPSNEGRGYVLRRILRRAMRHGNLISIKTPFLYDLSSILIDVMKDAYPELERARDVIASIIHLEEENFLYTLEGGLKILKNDIKNIAAGGILSGDQAFKLYDTYGFPLDLTQDILKAEKISVDTDGFEKALRKQRNKTKWTGSGDEKEDAIWLDLKAKLNATDFVGYETDEFESSILAIVQNGKENASLLEGKAFLITKSTPFYAECGGQSGDIGFIGAESGLFKVMNTQKMCDTIIVHEGELVSGSFRISDMVKLKIDSERRQKIRANHTATHLLQAALRHTLGNHVAQRGSFLDENRLRLDFSHHSSISLADLLKVEKMINNWIVQNLPVICRVMPKNEAITSGALALFGEKYGDYVRTVCVGTSCGEKVSFELCGGTHAFSTGTIGMFKILSESSIGSGIRRIEAITGIKVLDYFNDMEQSMHELSEKLKCGKTEVLLKVSELLTSLKQKNQEITKNKQKQAIEKIQNIQKSGICVCYLVVSDYSFEELRLLNDAVRSKNSSGIVIIAAQNADKSLLIVGVSQDLQKQYDATQILKIGLTFLGGKGGGNPSFAQGSGVGDMAKIKTAMERMLSCIA